MSAAPPDPFAVPRPVAHGPFAVPAAPPPEPGTVGWGWAPTPVEIDRAVLPRRSATIAGRAPLATALVALATVATVVRAFGAAHQLTLVHEVQDRLHAGASVTPELAQRLYDNDSFNKGAQIAWLTCGVAAAIAFIAWQRSVDRAARDLGCDLAVSRGWVVAGWLVPIAWFFQPPRSVADIAKAFGVRSGLVAAWWVAWLLGFWGGAVGAGHDPSGDIDADISAYALRDHALMVAAGFLVLAAVLAWQLVGRVSRGARRRLLEAAVLPAGASAAG